MNGSYAIIAWDWLDNVGESTKTQCFNLYQKKQIRFPCYLR